MVTSGRIGLWLVLAATAAACGGATEGADYPSDLDTEATESAQAAAPSHAHAMTPPPPAPTTLAPPGPPPAAADGGTPPGTAPDGGPVAPDAAVGPGTISGTVVTDPPRLRGQVVVYLEDGPKNPDRGMSASVNQASMQFIPYVSVVAEGGTVRFLNSDPFPHNVFSSDGARFDLGKISKGGQRVHVFHKAAVYRLLCNLHPSMLAYVVVTPSSYFATVKKDGSYSIDGVPPGTYHVTAWGPRLDPATQVVTVSGGAVNVEFQLHKGK